mgnify:CR=1 FL=1
MDEPPVSLVLFDLDGTIADTARDLFCALERLCKEESKQPPAYETFRSVVSQGSAAMLNLSFEGQLGNPHFDKLRDRLLTYYHQDIANHTVLFDGMSEVLDEFDDRGIKWGIVTNKPGWLTNPLLAKLDLDTRAICVIAGDTLARRKPHPDQLLHACELTGIAPSHSTYVGDARSDIVAGRRAGMRTIAVLFGYIPVDENPHTWGADIIISTPTSLISWVNE